MSAAAWDKRDKDKLRCNNAARCRKFSGQDKRTRSYCYKVAVKLGSAAPHQEQMMQKESAKDFPELMRTKAMEAGLKEVTGAEITPGLLHGAYEGPKYLFEYVIAHEAENATITIRVTESRAPLQEDVAQMMHSGPAGGGFKREYKLTWNGHVWLSGLDNGKRSNSDLVTMIVSIVQ